MRDLRSTRAVYAKAALFALIGTISALLLVLRDPSLTTVVLIVLAVWSFARLYYFAFYVLERYVDPSFRFSGLGSVLRYIARSRRNSDAVR